jgi:heme exporter protein D
MKWEGLTHFIAMGGYGVFVWGSYAVTALVVAVEIVLLARRHRAARAAAARGSDAMPERG